MQINNVFSKINSTSGLWSSEAELPLTDDDDPVSESDTPLTPDALSDSSDYDHSPESFPPSPKQPRIEEEAGYTLAANVDVADVAKRRSTLTESEKYNFYENHFSPGQGYKFPREKSRSFRHQYLQRYTWLIYSPKENGG